MNLSLVLSAAMILIGFAMTNRRLGQGRMPYLAFFGTVSLGMLVYGIVEPQYRLPCFLSALIGFSGVYRRGRAGSS